MNYRPKIKTQNWNVFRRFWTRNRSGDNILDKTDEIIIFKILIFIWIKCQVQGLKKYDMIDSLGDNGILNFFLILINKIKNTLLNYNRWFIKWIVTVFFVSKFITKCQQQHLLICDFLFFSRWFSKNYGYNEKHLKKSTNFTSLFVPKTTKKIFNKNNWNFIFFKSLCRTSFFNFYFFQTPLISYKSVRYSLWRITSEKMSLFALFIEIFFP